MKAKGQETKNKSNISDTLSMSDVEAVLPSSDANLAAVRDILFGAQIRETNEQRSNLEKQLKELILDLQKGFNERFNVVSKEMATMRKEVDTAAEKSTQVFNKKLDKLNVDLSASLQELDKSTSAADADLADQLHTNVSTLNTQMEKWKVDILSELDAAHSQLMHDKTDRESLAALFSSLSEQLLDDKKSKK